MASKKQRNKGWLLPDPVTGYDLLCVTMKIPDVPEYRAAFLGAVYELMKWFNWEKSFTPDDRRAVEAAQMWRELILEHLKIFECEEDCGCGCDDCGCDDCDD